MALNLTLRKAFLYIFASVGLILMIIGGVSLIDLGLKSYVFTKADNYCYERSPVAPVEKIPNGTTPLTAEQQKAEDEWQKKQCEESRTASRQGQASNAIAMLIVGIPLYSYHWMQIRKENQV